MALSDARNRNADRDHFRPRCRHSCRISAAPWGTRRATFADASRGQPEAVPKRTCKRTWVARDGTARSRKLDRGGYLLDCSDCGDNRCNQLRRLCSPVLQPNHPAPPRLNPPTPLRATDRQFLPGVLGVCTRAAPACTCGSSIRRSRSASQHARKRQSWDPDLRRLALCVAHRFFSEPWLVPALQPRSLDSQPRQPTSSRQPGWVERWK
jgi:hypothetical protein